MTSCDAPSSAQYFIASPPASPKVEEAEEKASLTAAPEEKANAVVSEAPKTATRVKSFRAEAQGTHPVESPSLEDARKARTARRSQSKSKIAERSEEHTSELTSLMRISYAV